MLLCPPVLYKFMDRMVKVRLHQSHKNEQECRFSGEVVKFRYSLFMILPIMTNYESMHLNIFSITNLKKISMI